MIPQNCETRRMVFGMTDEHVDPSGNTEAFRAFATRVDIEPKPDGKARRWVLIGAVAAVVVVAVVLIVALA